MSEISPPSLRAVTLRVNGVDYTREVEPRLLLSDFLRHAIGLSGTRVGCEHGVCGACTVQIDGLPVRSCLTFAVQAEGSTVKTIEGVAAADGTLHPLQQAFQNAHALQCGYCTSGVLMTLLAFLDDNPAPDETEIRDALSGNICRCTGYQHMVDAVLAYAPATGKTGATS